MISNTKTRLGWRGGIDLRLKSVLLLKDSVRNPIIFLCLWLLK